MSELSPFLMCEVEMPLIEVVADMEDNGYPIDAGYYRGLQRELDPKRDEAAAQLKAIAGEDFNPGSAKQVGELLYGELNLPIPKRTDTGQPSTSKATLEQLDHEAARLLLTHRKLTKVIGTYCNLPDKTGDDGRLHVEFRQIGADTGRFTSSSVIQTIPKEDDECNLRQGFRPPEGAQIVAADFDQQELRILAGVSGDKNMLAAIHEGADLHGLAAVKVFGLDCEPNEVAEKYKDERKRVKAIQFGLLYGRGVFSLAAQLGISREEAQTLMDDYFAQFPGVQKFVQQVHAQVVRDGRVEDLFGRRRHLPDAQLRRPRKQYSRMTVAEREVVRKISSAKRKAQNFVIQGPAATITKLAMLRCDRHLKADHPGIKMILQVHDELHFEVPGADVDHFACELPGLMCELELERFQFEVPMSVKVQAGPSWGELKAHEGDHDRKDV